VVAREELPAVPACMRPRDAASYLGISVTTLYRLLRAGEIPFIQARGATLIRLADMDGWLQRKAQEPARLRHRGRGYRAVRPRGGAR
jgi:excisionase family DNA binding protein